jgi:hypothetical protein
VGRWRGLASATTLLFGVAAGWRARRLLTLSAPVAFLGAGQLVRKEMGLVGGNELTVTGNPSCTNEDDETGICRSSRPTGKRVATAAGLCYDHVNADGEVGTDSGTTLV